ncbi:hypothetical protein [Candidatus Roseilinea sp. NK_OTU-006]|uniref:hypothetical protein n=1 Tax=Candidatus Roseilinea sp. NK_OTU-006 TaxID=2704250 RepID=UPI00145C8182|nr:hypothetical protein [Candidatus Roseilinea sp. NK_OTU-006]
MDYNRDEWLDLELETDSDAQIIELLAGDLTCPLCGSPYEPSAIHLVRQRCERITLAVQCHRCGTGSLITAPHVFRLASPPSELTPIERAFFACLPPISDADVARLRRLLRAHTGGLRDLL